MELSKRLQAVAGCVNCGSRLADIGTDHAYIPIELVRKGRIPEAIAMDVRRGPLECAKENICRYGLTDKIKTRLSNGFAALKRGEADTAVVAGMGGGLIIRILSEGMETVRSLDECVLQPQSEIEKVRAFLLEEGFLFLAEEMVEDAGKYYPVMRVSPPKIQYTGATVQDNFRKKSDVLPMWNQTELLYGKYLLENRNPVLHAFLEREYRIKSEIFKALEGQNSDRARQRRQELGKEIEYIEKGMSYYAVQRNHAGD